MPTDPAHPTTATAPEPLVPRYGEKTLADLASSTLAMVDVPGCRNPLGLFPPGQLQPGPTVFELAVGDGVTVSRLGPGEHAASGLTRSVLRGGAFVDVHSLGDLAAAAGQRLAAARRSLVYAYHADLDR